MEDSLLGVDVQSSDGKLTRIMRTNREPFELDGVRYVLTGNRHGTYTSMHETAVPDASIAD